MGLLSSVACGSLPIHDLQLFLVKIESVLGCRIITHLFVVCQIPTRRPKHVLKHLEFLAYLMVKAKLCVSTLRVVHGSSRFELQH